MRFPYPKNWTFYTREQKQKWLKENGQRIIDEQQAAEKKFLEDIKKREEKAR